MARFVPPLRALGIWIGALLVGAAVCAVTVAPDGDTELVAGEARQAPLARVTTTVLSTTTSTEPPTTTTSAVLPSSTTTTTTAPAPAPTTAPSPTTTTPAPEPAFTMSPEGPMSSSSGGHYTLAGSGCTAERVVLRVYGGALHGDAADYATVASDGTWGIGFMVHPAGSYELRAECAHHDWSVVLTYAPVSFTILP